MVRFKKYIEKDIRLEHIKNADKLKTFGITPQYVPDTPDEFEEFEFTTDFGKETVLVGIAVQLGKIKRVILGLTDPTDPDSFMALSKSQLEDFLNQKGEQLVRFFEYIT
ncbi:MAG: hypothetical protein Q8P40_01250 [Nitrospirota bacterium]|nr:hypothetical protein [Nitrospirota bacterium]